MGETLRISWFALAFSIAALFAGPAAAEYPDRPVTLVVGFAPGGSTDVVARLLAKSLAEQLGTNVIVSNRPGASTNIATTFVARSNPDGYTLLMASPSQTINASLYQNLPFNFERDFTPISLFASNPAILLISSTIPDADLRTWLAHVRAQPGKFSFASPGVGSTAHLAAELFKKSAGVDLVHIPYKGEGQAIVDVIAGRVQMMFGFYSAAAPYIKSGQLKPLAVATSKRLRELPNVPTLD